MDLPYSITIIGIIAMIIPIALIYYVLCHSIIGAIVSAIVMTITGFLFASVVGYLVGTIGSSNNPISGITLSTLIVAAFRAFPCPVILPCLRQITGRQQAIK